MNITYYCPTCGIQILDKPTCEFIICSQCNDSYNWNDLTTGFDEPLQKNKVIFKQMKFREPTIKKREPRKYKNCYPH